MAEPQVLSRVDFSGGLVASSSPYAIPANAVLRLENMLLDESGALYSRDGAVTVDGDQQGTTGILTLYDLSTSTGTLFHLAVCRTTTGQVLRRRGSGQPWPTLGTFATSYDLPTMNTFRNLAVIAAGYEPIKYFDGTTFGALTALVDEVAPPGAKHLAVHLGSLWAWNTAAVTDATDGPSSLRCSAVNNPNSWPLENQTFISNDDGQQGQGLGVFTVADTGISPQGVLVAFKEYSTYIVTGLFASVNFNIEKAKTDLGCIAPRTIQFLSGAGIIRLTHRGFAVFDGTGDTLLSEPIRPYLFPQRVFGDIQALDWAQLSRSTATLVQNPPLYVCACPLGPGPELTRVFVYDLLRKGWTILTFPVAYATIDSQFDPGVVPFVIAGQQGGGHVQELFSAADSDDGRPVSWKVRLQPLAGNSPTQRFYIRRVLAKVAGMSAGQQVTGRAVFGPAAQQVGPRTRTSASSVATTLSPDAGLEGMVEATLNFDIGRSGEVLYYELEGTGPIILRELAQHARPKPASRPMRL